MPIITVSEGTQSVVQSGEICSDCFGPIVSIPLPDYRAKFISDSEKSPPILRPGLTCHADEPTRRNQTGFRRLMCRRLFLKRPPAHQPTRRNYNLSNMFDDELKKKTTADEPKPFLRHRIPADATKRQLAKTIQFRRVGWCAEGITCALPPITFDYYIIPPPPPPDASSPIGPILHLIFHPTLASRSPDNETPA